MPGGQRLRKHPFAEARVKTALPAHDRLALFLLRNEHGEEPCQATVRRVIDAGLTALGYPPGQRTKDYQEYQDGCRRGDLVNEFESR
jgi:hypothetical protein